MANNVYIDGKLTAVTTAIGLNATNTVGFYGAAPAAQPAVLAAVTTIQPSVTSFGFTTTAQFNALIAAVNTLVANMKTLGLMATS